MTDALLMLIKQYQNVSSGNYHCKTVPRYCTVLRK